MEAPPTGRRPRRIVLLPLLVAIASLAFLLLAIKGGWLGPPDPRIGREFCESYDGLIKQPVNTWSNLGFTASGLAVAWLMSRNAFAQNDNAFTRSTFTPTFFASLVILVGPCSMAMHATLSRVGGKLDLLSMFLVTSFMTAYAMQRFFRWRPRHFTAVFLVTTLASESAALYRPLPVFTGRNAFLFFIGVAVVFELLNSYVRRLEHQTRWIFLGLLTFAVALTFWILWKTDTPRCDPHGLFQGHAVWHLLDALALFFLFRFYVSEHRSRAGGGNSPLRQ